MEISLTGDVCKIIGKVKIQCKIQNFVNIIAIMGPIETELTIELVFRDHSQSSTFEF
jgi:hypothetical protein